MAKFHFSSDRKFQLWFATVGHSQVLFRSLASTEHEAIDILFKSTDEMSVRSQMHGLVIEEINRIQLSERLGHPIDWNHHLAITPELRAFLLHSEGWTGYVIAGSVFCDKELSLGMVLTRQERQVREVLVTVTDPWDWVTENGSGPFPGKSVALSHDLLLVELNKPIKHGGKDNAYVLASTRSSSASQYEQLINDLGVGSDLIPIPKRAIPTSDTQSMLDSAHEFAKAFRQGGLLGSVHSRKPHW
jgi:hypothetical protein